MEIEKIKAAIDIAKAKLAFFSALVGGISYIAINVKKLLVFINGWFLTILLTTLLLYALSGVVINLRELNTLRSRLWQTQE